MSSNPNTVLISKTFRFLHNIPYDFIDQVWDPKTTGWINAHLKGKFHSYCRADGYASPNAILSFFFFFYDENSRIFCEAIAKKINS